MTCMIKRQKYERHCKNYAEGMSYMWSFLFSPGDSNKFILIPVPPSQHQKKSKNFEIIPLYVKNSNTDRTLHLLKRFF